MTMTEWKDVPCWERFYEVSCDGLVRSKNRTVTMNRCGQLIMANLRARPIAPFYGKSDYLMVSLQGDGRCKNLLVHRLVASAFIGPQPPSCTMVLHIDGNKYNNHFTNLRYGTAKENAEDAIRHDTLSRGEKHHNSKINMEIARAIRSDSATMSTLALSKKYPLSRKSIDSILRGETWRERNDTE